MKQTLFRVVSLAIVLVIAAGFSVSCEPVEPDPDPTPVTVAVTGVSLDKTSLNLLEGEIATLSATVSPANATNKTVTWSTDNASIANVAEDGTVTAIAQGTAIITAKVGGKQASCKVTVIPDSVDSGHEGIGEETWE